MSLLTLFLVGVTIGAGVVAGRALALALARGLESVAHAIRWHVYRPLLRRRYLRRVDKYRDNLDRGAAMRRHPSSDDANNRALS